MADRQALLRARFELGSVGAFAFTCAIIPTIIVWLWNDAAHSGLLLWGGLLLALAPLPLIVQSRPVSFPTWFTLEMVVELALGVVWGLLPWLAMPETQLNQALLAGVLVGVLVASSTSSSQFMTLHLAFVVPYGGLTTAAFLTGAQPLYAAALFLVFALAFSVSMASDLRTTHVQLVDLLGENDALVDELADERDALTAANSQLDRQAWFDPLTGLANRAAMTRHIQSTFATASSTEQRVTVAYLDLDGFKAINDTLGHRVGDLVLIEVAERLTGTIGDTALVCRLGGDEITVLGMDLKPERLGERLALVFDDPFHIEGRQMRISAGIGVATMSAPWSADELLRFADRALYRHKARTDRTVRYKVFDTDMLDELRVHEATEVELVAAFDSGQIAAWLQPVVDMGTGAIVAAESLARWEHPDGLRHAEQFISHLAERRLLGELADRTIAQVGDLNIRLAAEGVSGFRISVNIPPTEIEGVLRRHEHADVLSRLVIEVTEDSAAPNADRIANALTQARQAGAQVWIDDFGTGFSSLALTTTLPIDGLKIDASFVSDLNDPRSRAVVTAIAGLGRDLGLMIIAEGVESEVQAQELLSLGVEYAQGFLYAPAVPANELVDWVLGDARLGPKATHTGDVAA